MGWRSPIAGVLTMLALGAAACTMLPGRPFGTAQGRSSEPAPTDLPTTTLTATEAPTTPPTSTNTPSPETTSTHTPAPTSTHTPTATLTPTPLPAGYVAVPDVTGLHYRDARLQILRSGLNFVYHDVLDLDLPVGTI